jgi:hypothetical protein
MASYPPVTPSMQETLTKFGKAEKTGCSGFLVRIVQFWQCQTQIKEGAKIEDRSKGSLSMEKGGKVLKDQEKRNSS